MAKQQITVEKCEDGTFVIIQRVQRVFNYCYASCEIAEAVAEKLRKEQIAADPNYKPFNDIGQFVKGSSTKGTASNKNNTEAWFLLVI